MKLILSLFLMLSFVFSATAATFGELEKMAREKTGAKSRLALAAEESLKTIQNADALESGGVPNYIRAMAQNTKAAPQFANLVQTFLFGGTVAPETKMAIGLKIAQVYNSPYTFAHAKRWLAASEKGQIWLKNFEADKLEKASPAEQAAIRYAALLSEDVHGITDEEFQNIRGFYNDSQIVELTMTVCFYSKQVQTPQQGLGNGIANSQRAMLRVPALAQARREFGAQNRQNWAILRNIQLQISFAVSNANGCRYCTLHQILGLKKLGVDPKKLLAMKKDDSVLTARELSAVVFARKLTKDPASITDEDFAKLKTEFGDQGATEVVLQPGNFAFMNRFTDNLRLPSEDEAIDVYQEIYGKDSVKNFSKH